MLVYARTSENDYIAPEASVTGTFEAVERLFFVDASANVTQQYVSPFGARSVALANATQNRYTAQAYTISPYTKGSAGDGVSYLLRQQSVWSDAAGLSAGTSTNRSYTSGVDGNITREARPGGGVGGIFPIGHPFPRCHRHGRRFGIDRNRTRARPL
jgi:hypothetical protein